MTNSHNSPNFLEGTAGRSEKKGSFSSSFHVPFSFFLFPSNGNENHERLSTNHEKNYIVQLYMRWLVGRSGGKMCMTERQTRQNRDRQTRRVTN